jgi:hypothetical protein
MKNSQPTRRRFAEVCLQGALGGAAIASAATPDSPEPPAHRRPPERYSALTCPRRRPRRR